MLFNDFNIELVSENFCSLFWKLNKKIDAEWHITWIENRNCLCRIFDFCNLIFRKACCADNTRYFVINCIRKHTVKSCRIWKINDYIRCFGCLVKSLENIKIIITFTECVNTEQNIAILTALNSLCHKAAHFTVTTDYCCIYHFYSPLNFLNFKRIKGRLFNLLA